MQVIEDVKKHLLRTVFPCQKLDVVDDQHVHLHVEVGEALHVALLDGVHELVHKFFGRNVEDKFFLRSVFDFVANGLHKVRFPKSYTSVHHQGVEGSDAWFAGYRKPCRAGEAVAVSFDIANKGIVWIQVALGKHVCIQRLHFKGGLYFGGVRGILFGRSISLRKRDHIGLVGWVALVYHHGVVQAAVGTKCIFDGQLQHFHVIVFEPLVKKLARNLYGQTCPV